MDKCPQCNVETPSYKKFCSVVCTNRFYNAQRVDRRLGEFKTFDVTCFRCGKLTTTREREKQFPKREKYYCTRSCANTRSHSPETRANISRGLRQSEVWREHTTKLTEKRILKPCKHCQQLHANSQFCSRTCTVIWIRDNTELFRQMGQRSAQKQATLRRSKNEIAFATLCQEKFSNVVTNVAMFDGWDADVILQDQKVAVLWNGPWHYRKLTKKHSIEQVQNRDRIKLKKIAEAGYTSYVIEDQSGESTSKVQVEFQKFCDFIHLRTLQV
jgi:hypothetical protein